MTTVEERVIRGFDYLTDYYGPDWQDAIDVETLDLSNPCNCVLGQLADDYWQVYFNDTENRWSDMDDFVQWSYEHGFCRNEESLFDDEYDVEKGVAEYAELTRTWRNKLG